MGHLDVPEVLIALGIAGFFGLWLHNIMLNHSGRDHHPRQLHHHRR